jgi:glycosyltransferase involved in cell wall biosynthesis
MGLPVVATRIPGSSDVVEDGRTGSLVPVRDGEAMGAGVVRYLAEPAMRREHGRAARERVTRMFAREPLWREMAAFYGRLLGG